MYKVWRLMGALVLIGTTTQAAAAAPVVFTDEAAFDAALAAAGLVTSTESFEGVDAGIHGAIGLDGFVLDTFFLTGVTDEPGTATDGVHALVQIVPAFVPTYTFGAPIRAFSLDIVDPLNVEPEDFFVEIDGTVHTLFGGVFPDGHVQFVGLLDLVAPFTQLTFFSGSFTDVFFMDRVRFEQADASPVPEPASIALLSLGLLGAAARLRRSNRSRDVPRGRGSQGLAGAASWRARR